MSLSQSKVDLEFVKIMVIEENLHMRHIIRQLLLTLGCKEICEIRDPALALKELASFHADLVILEWNTEPIDGFEFVKMVRTAEDSPNQFVPILILSGFTELQHVARARDAGANDFLAKPVSAETLGKRLDALLSNPREFISTKNYFGPCRRRRNLGPPRGIADRRIAEATLDVTHSATNVSPSSV